MTKTKPKMLWVGDFVVESGFSRVGHAITRELADRWDIAVLGIVYAGDPHAFPFRVYTTTSATAGYPDGYGFRKLGHVIATEQPDVVCILQDPWVVAEYVRSVQELRPETTVAYMPLDGPSLLTTSWEVLSTLGCAVFYTQFGQDAALAAGFAGRSEVVPHGVDLRVYRPVDPQEARRPLGKAADGFVVGYVSRNQVRKRMDMAIHYFSEWVHSRGVDDAWLYLHCDPRDPTGVPIPELARYFGVADRMIINPQVTAYAGLAEHGMAKLYSSFDVHAMTTLGEGWGLPAMESMACGVPNILPAWAGLGDWAREHAVMVPCTGRQCTPYAVHGVVDAGGFIGAIDTFYRDRWLREKYATLGRDLVSDPRFRWANIAWRFDAILRSVVKA